MKLEVPQFLKLAAANNSILFFDLETQGLNADYGRILVYSRKFNDGEMRTTFGERKILRAMRADFDKADLIIGYNSRVFDVPYANTRFLELGQDPLPKKHHLDMYFALKSKLRTTSKAMGAIGTLLNLAEDKMKVAPKEWRNANLPVLASRCESDVRLLQQVFNKTKHLVLTITI